MAKRLVIVGTGMQAEQVDFYFGRLGGRDIDAFLLDPEYMHEPSFLGRPVLAFAEAQRRFPPSTHEMFVAIGMLATQARKCWFLAGSEAGYTLPSYVHPTASVAENVVVGANSLIKEQAVVAPFARLGVNITVCVSACVSHHVVVGSHSFLGPAAVVAGAAVIGECCFVGARATLRDRVQIGEGCVIGAGALVMGDCPPGGIYRAERTPRTGESTG